MKQSETITIVMSLQGCLQAKGKEYCFVEDKTFVPVKNILDNHMKELSQQGIVTAKRQSQPLTYAEEDKLWQMGLLGNDLPEKLLNMLIYLLGVHFALRGVQEHKDLRVDAYRQITVCFDEELQKEIFVVHSYFNEESPRWFERS